MPTAVPTLQRLVTDLSRRVRNLQAKLDAYTQDCPVVPTSSTSSATTSLEPSNETENLSIIRDDKTDIGALDELRRLTIGQTPNRHLGKSSSLMLVKSAMDLKQLSSNNTAVAVGTRRMEFWGDQPVRFLIHLSVSVLMTLPIVVADRAVRRQRRHTLCLPRPRPAPPSNRYLLRRRKHHRSAHLSPDIRGSSFLQSP